MAGFPFSRSTKQGWSIIGECIIRTKTESDVVYEWDIVVGDRPITVGIASITIGADERSFSSMLSGTAYYALATDGRLEYHDNGRAIPHKDYYDGRCAATPGSTIKMILDVGKRTISFVVNGNNLGVAFENIDTYRYRFSASWPALDHTR